MSPRVNLAVLGPLQRFVRALRDYWPALLTGVVVALLGAGLAWMLRRDEDREIERLLDFEGRSLTSEAARAIQVRGLELTGLARRIEHSGAPPESVWTREAESLLGADPVIRAIEWRDEATQPIASVPVTAARARGELDPAVESTRLQVLIGLSNQDGWAVSPSFQGAQRRRQIAITAPLVESGRSVGFLVGIVRVRDLLDEITQRETHAGFSVAARDGPYRIYGPLASDEGPDAETWSRTHIVTVSGLAWTFDSWPSEELMGRLHTMAPMLALVLGLLAACTLAACVRAIQLGGRRERSARPRRVPEEADLDVEAAPGAEAPPGS